jgi:prephenate dehydrogenase
MKGNVLVIGTGLIGGSLALSIKKEHPEATIIGFDANENNLQIGKSLKILDVTTENFNNAAQIANLIIIATPVQATIEVMKRLSKLNLLDDVLITDTGSTKESIMELSNQLFPSTITFIGGHPMAGSHKSGITAAKDLLFENAYYILTPRVDGDRAKLERLQEWLKGTKARFMVMQPSEHDFSAGVISHLPHIVASALVLEAKEFQEDHPHIAQLAAGGFRDITRIASSDPFMWRDITLHNRVSLLSLIDSWQKSMNQIKKSMLEQNEEELYRFFKDAKQFRDQLPQGQKGAIPAYFDLLVDVPDYPGVISEVTGFLSEQEISLTNIRILETREDIYGVLVISFQNEKDRELARECLQEKTNYEIFLS